MSFRLWRIQSVCRGAATVLLSVAVALLFGLAAAASPAKAAYYRMVLCAANNGSNGFQTATNTTSPQNPGGIFNFENYCGPAPFPAGNNAFLRLDENQGGGSAGYTAYGSMSWTTVPWVDIVAGGGYTREPNAFNDGWRGRFWLEGWDGSTNNELMQGSGVQNGDCGGVCWATTSTFASHLWPFGGYGKYRRFVFELTCFRQAGCDRSNFNAVDANTMILTLNDVDNSHINFTNTGSGILAGQWVRGTQNVTWNVSDQGSGMRFERLRVDGGERYSIDWRGNCNIDYNGGVGEFARDFQPCPIGGPWGRTYGLNTAAFSDGGHTVQVCSQDYGQSVGLSGSGGESCDQRSIHVDNNPPAAPGGLAISTSNPGRYLSHFGAHWSLASDPGSPIAKVHYNVVNAAGEVVVPEKTISATNPTELKDIEGPAKPGDYRLRVWIEDSVGFNSPVASIPVPHDTVPPGAPQGVAVASPNSSRAQEGFDVTWRNIVDSGSPISDARYQVLNGAGAVVVPTQTIHGDNVQAIQNLESPSDRGQFTLRLWLADAEGNEGAPVSVPLSYECPRSPVLGGQQLTAEFGGSASKTVKQGEGATVNGVLQGLGGQISGAPLCVFSNPVTDADRDFLGMAVTGDHGEYHFAIPAGPSRKVSVLYRPNQRQVGAAATLLTIVHPTFRARSPVVENHHFAYFEGDIPGPHNNQVVIVLQVRNGKGWLAFRRYRTRNDGHYELAYKFNRTGRPTTYEMRAQVRQTTGYPYEQGNSDPLLLKVVPQRPGSPIAHRHTKHKRHKKHRHHKHRHKHKHKSHRSHAVR